MAAGIGHGLAAAGLVEGIVDLAAEPLEQFQRRDPDLGKERVDVTGDEEGDAHEILTSSGGPAKKRTHQRERKPLIALLTLRLPVLAFALSSLAGPAAAMPDTFLARIETLASIETLNAEILASSSATRALEHWCEVHAMAPDPKVHAELVRGDDRPLDDAGRQRLGLASGETVKYRHVRLTCGGHMLSEADNWYVPSRLTPEMNHVLETTDTPFGKAVASLHFTRQTFAVDGVWSPLPDDWQIRPPAPDHPAAQLAIPRILFTHHAVLHDAANRAFSEVAEHYTRELLDFGQAGSPPR